MVSKCGDGGGGLTALSWGGKRMFEHAFLSVATRRGAIHVITSIQFEFSIGV